MRIYYCEWDIMGVWRPVQFTAESDAMALMAVTNKKGLYMYRESDTPNGLPFVTVYDDRAKTSIERWIESFG